MEFTNSRNLEIGLGLYLVARFYLYLGGYADGRSPVVQRSTSPWPPVLFADDPTVPLRRRLPVILVTALYALYSPDTGTGIPARRLAIAIGSLAPPKRFFCFSCEAWSSFCR